MTCIAAFPKSSRKENQINASATASHLKRYLENKGVPRSLAYSLSGFLNHWVAKRLAGETTIYPGNKRIAVWGRVKARQTKKNVKKLEELGIIARVRYESGGRGRAPEFVVSVRAIRRYLIVEFNPSKQLLEKLKELEHFDVNSPEKGCTQIGQKGAQKGAASAPRIYTYNPDLRNGRSPREEVANQNNRDLPR